LQGFDVLPSYAEVTVSDEFQEVKYATHTKVPIICTERYLQYLYDRFAKFVLIHWIMIYGNTNSNCRAGGAFYKETITDLMETKQKYNADIIVNCTGLGSRELVNDSSMFGMQGQLVKLKPSPKVTQFVNRSDVEFAEYKGCKLVTYVFPRADSIVIGGYIEPEGKLPLTPSPEVTKILVCVDYVGISFIQINLTKF
jgi:hypothetical protein